METHTHVNSQSLNKWKVESGKWKVSLPMLQWKVESGKWKVLFCVFCFFILCFSLYSQELYQPFFDDPNPPKSATTAMFMSAVFPGAGQFYVSKTQWTAYVFPVIEIGLFYALFHYHKKGDDKTREYERYADEHYERKYQYWTQWDLVKRHIDPPDDQYGNTIGGYIYNNGNWQNWEDSGHHWGNGSFFRLEYENSQHFYEDIAKYDKYVFGWLDWFDKYVYGEGFDVIVNWHWNEHTNLSEKRWLGNYAKAGEEGEWADHWDKPNSAYREVFIQMRKDAEKSYTTSRSLRFFLLANHVVAAIDANRVARKYNKLHMPTQRAEYGIKVGPNVYTTMVNDNLVPILGLNLSF